MLDTARFPHLHDIVLPDQWTRATATMPMNSQKIASGTGIVRLQ